MDLDDHPSNTTMLVAMSLAVVIAIGGFVVFTLRRRKEEARRKAYLAKTRPASLNYLEQLSDAPSEEPLDPIAALAENNEADPEQQALNAEFSGKFDCQFGITSAPEKVHMAMAHTGALHITAISVYAHGEAIGRSVGSQLIEGGSGFRIDPTRSHGYYDPEEGVISLCDSINPRRWYVMRPKAGFKTAETDAEAFTAVVAALIAVMGARLEARELRGTSFGGAGRLILGTIITLVIIVILVVMRLLLTESR